MIMRFKGLLFFMALAGTGAFAAADDNTLTEEEKKAGWRLLFDGKTSTGWRGYKKDKFPDGWKIQDGMMSRVTGGGDIVTVDQYENFELLVDWKITEGSNSGVMFRVQETEKSPYMTGPEIQILDDDHHKVPHTGLTATGSCYALYPPTKDAVKPIGEWNRFRIVMNHNKGEVWLNGEKIVEYEIGSPDWNKKVEGSKFKEWGSFAKSAKGYIDLQDHGGRVDFKNIKIKVLD
jgi:hypothetical protein